MVVAAPKDEVEFQHLIYSAVTYGKPVAIRYPRGNGGPSETVNTMKTIPIGSGEILRQGNDLAILAIGATVFPALEAAAKLAAGGLQCSVANARFAKPLDLTIIQKLAGTTGRIITIEENSLIGGFGSAVLEMLTQNKVTARVECMGLPDVFIEHGNQDLLRAKYELDSKGIVNRVKKAFPELFTGASTGGRVS